MVGAETKDGRMVIGTMCKVETDTMEIVKTV